MTATGECAERVPASSGLFVGGSWVVLARAIGALGFAGSSVLLARLLGTANFGYFSLISSVSVGCGFVAAMGVNRTLLKQIAVRQAVGETEALAAEQRLSLRVLSISVPLAGLATAGVVVEVGGFGGVARLPLAVATSALVMLSGLQLVVADGLRAYGRRAAASFLEGRSGGAVSFVALTAVLLPFLGRSLGLTDAVALSVLAYALVLPIWWLLLRPRWMGVTRAARRSGLPVEQGWRRRFLTTSIAFAGTQLFAFASNQGDIWIVAAVASASQLSLFSASFRLVVVIATPLLALQLTLTPAVAALYGTGQIAELESMARRAARLATLPALLCLAVIVAEPRALTSLIFGAGFAGGAAVLVWLTVGQVINSATGLCGQVLTMTGHQRDALWIGAVAFAVKLAVGIPVARATGIVGYAAVTSLTTAAMNVAYLLSVRARLGIWTHPGLRLAR